MKPLTAALFLSVALTGAACSDAVKAKAETSPPGAGTAPLPVDTSTATSETELGGTLNLNIGGSGQQSSSGRLLGSGGLNSSSESGIVLGAGGLGGGNFGEAPSLGIDLNDDTGAPVAGPAGNAAPASGDDDIVRLPN